jgi:hypothetical protein
VSFEVIWTTDRTQVAIVALMSRALAGFLGIARDRSGKLVKASEYYEHTSGSSYEVKISDLNGGQLIEPQKLPRKVQKTLSDGTTFLSVVAASIRPWAYIRVVELVFYLRRSVNRQQVVAKLTRNTIFGRNIGVEPTGLESECYLGRGFFSVAKIRREMQVVCHELS